jgi:hypothetical protein
VAIDEQAIVIVPVTGDGELGGFSLPHLPSLFLRQGKRVKVVAGQAGKRASS